MGYLPYGLVGDRRISETSTVWHTYTYITVSLRAKQPVLSDGRRLFVAAAARMNIFFLSMSPKEAAKFHANIHVVKMIAAWLKADTRGEARVLDIGS